MKILFDYQIFEMQKFGGISRYFFELLNHFDTDPNVEWELPVAYSNNEYLKSFPEYKERLLPKSTPDLAYKKFLEALRSEANIWCIN